MVVFPTGIVSEHLAFEASFPVVADAGIEQRLASLVLTGHEPLRERLKHIAEARGCACRAPATVTAAWRELAAGPRLVFIDISHPIDGRADEARAIAEAFAQRPGVMLVVCGSPPATTRGIPVGDDERWARQVGAFVYLPGVGGDAGVTLIVDEARRICGGKR